MVRNIQVFTRYNVSSSATQKWGIKVHIQVVNSCQSLQYLRFEHLANIAVFVCSTKDLEGQPASSHTGTMARENCQH